MEPEVLLSYSQDCACHILFEENPLCIQGCGIACSIFYLVIIPVSFNNRALLHEIVQTQFLDNINNLLTFVSCYHTATNHCHLHYVNCHTSQWPWILQNSCSYILHSYWADHNVLLILESLQFRSVILNVVVRWLALLLCIWYVSDSNLGSETSYPN
jgi:hypothetical protein